MPTKRKQTSTAIAAGAPRGCSADFRVVAARGSVSLQAAQPAADGQPAKLPTIAIEAYNGGTIDVGWGFPVVIDLAGLDVSGHARPILKDHNPGLVVGHSTSIRHENGRALALDGVMSGTGDAAREVQANAANGFPWQASVGVSARNYEYVKEGSTGKANGQEFQGPLYIVRKGVLQEVSVVAIGADNTTKTSIAARHNQNGDTMKFNEWLKAKGFEPDTLTDAQRTTLQAAYDAEVGAGDPAPSATQEPATVAATLAEFRQAQAAETQRVAAIRAACGGKHSDLEAKAIAEGWTAEKLELAVLRAERPKAPAAGGASGLPGAGFNAKAAVAALLIAHGVGTKTLADDRSYTERDLDAAHSREYRNVSLQALMFRCIEAAGGHVPPGRVDNDTIRAAFEADRKLRASGYSDAALTNMLGAVYGKTALNSFGAVESAADQFVAPYDAQDFKTFTMVRLVEGGDFQKVGPTGELKHGKLSEEAFTNKVDTRGMVLTLTRQDIINDDLGRLLQLIKDLSRGAAIAKEKHVFETLLANAGNFFHANNGNLLTGAGSVWGIDALTSLEQKMLDMTVAAKKPILAAPKILLVPTSLKAKAQLMMKEDRVNETTTTDKGKPAANPHVGKWKVVASPYLNAQGLSGSSSTAFYLFADPNDIPALQVAYLRGQRGPTIESGDLDFDQLGMGWRGYFDFAAKLLDPKGAARSDGA